MSHETINVEKPRSYDAFIEVTGLDPDEVALQAFSKKMQEYRVSKAREMGITLEELHNSTQD